MLLMIILGIVAGVLDFDYAPSSCSVGNRRVWLNVSQVLYDINMERFVWLIRVQEGKSDVEFLREEELLNGLQMSSKSFQPITCYQISEKGNNGEVTSSSLTVVRQGASEAHQPKRKRGSARVLLRERHKRAARSCVGWKVKRVLY